MPQKRRHRHDGRRLHALDHFKNQRGRGCAGANHGAAEFAQAEPVGQPGHEAAIHRHGHQHRVVRGQPGATEGNFFVQCQSPHISIGEHPQQRLAGRATGGDDFNHPLAWDAEKIQVAPGQDAFVHRRQSFKRRHAIRVAKLLAVERRTGLRVAKSFRPESGKRRLHRAESKISAAGFPAIGCIRGSAAGCAGRRQIARLRFRPVSRRGVRW